MPLFTHPGQTEVPETVPTFEKLCAFVIYKNSGCTIWPKIHRTLEDGRIDHYDIAAQLPREVIHRKKDHLDLTFQVRITFFLKINLK